MSLGTDLLERLFGATEYPWPRRIRRALAVTIVASAGLFPATFRTAVGHYAEERACSLEQPLVSAMTVPGATMSIREHNGVCAVVVTHAQPKAPAGGSPAAPGGPRP